MNAKAVLERIFYDPYKSVRRDRRASIGESKLGRTFRIRYYVPRGSMAFRAGDGCILMNENIFESDQGFIGIGDRTFINAGTKIISRIGVEIGNDVTIAWDCTIYDHDSHSLDYRERAKDQTRQLEAWESGNFVQNKDWSTVNAKAIRIMDNAWIGFGAVVLKGVTIGEGAVVGAMSVVASDVPAWSVVAGNPARVVKNIPAEWIKKHEASR